MAKKKNKDNSLNNKKGITLTTIYDSIFMLIKERHVLVNKLPKHIEKPKRPPLSRQRRLICDRYNMDFYSKMILLYEKQYWIQKGYSGQILSDCLDSPIFMTFDDSRINKHDQIHPAIVIFIAGAIDQEWLIVEYFFRFVQLSFQNYKIFLVITIRFKLNIYNRYSMRNNFLNQEFLVLKETNQKNINFLKSMKLPKLLLLQLSRNQLQSCDCFDEQQQFHIKISGMYFRQNKIIKFPHCRSNFINLSKLTLSKNNIENLQGLLSCSLPILQMLDVENNNLTLSYFMKKIGSSTFNHLKLAYNKITELQCLRECYLPSFEQLQIKKNKITSDICLSGVSESKKQNAAGFMIFSASDNNQIIKKQKNYFTYIKNTLYKLSFLEL